MPALVTQVMGPAPVVSGNSSSSPSQDFEFGAIDKVSGAGVALGFIALIVFLITMRPRSNGKTTKPPYLD